MPYPNFHAARVRDPGRFQPNSIRNKTLPNSNGIQIIMGRLKGDKDMTPQAYRFPADKYTVAQARAWLRRHGVKIISFEKATGKEK